MIASLLCVLLAAPVAPPPPPPAVSPPPPAEAPPAPAASVREAGLLDRATLATVGLEKDGRVTSGVLISEVGLVLTTARPFLRGGRTQAALPDGRRVEASVLLVDPQRDLALLRLPAPGPYASLPLALRLPEAGEPVHAVWHPNALAWATGSGTLAARFAVRDGKVDPLLFRVQLKSPAEVEGGPVLDDAGKLLGVLGNSNGVGVDWVVSVEAVRGFLDRAGVYAPDFSLSVATAPPGATVTIDGRKVGTTASGQLQVDGLTMGRHEVRLSAPGAAEDVLGVQLLQQRVTALTRNLDAGGQVELSANGPGEAWVDGALRGNVPLLLTLPSGPHWVDVRAKTYLPGAASFEVKAGEHTAVNVVMERVFAELSLDTLPEGAQVTANGEVLGQTPLKSAKVPVGQVELGIQHPDKHGYRFQVTLGPRESRDLGTYRLEEPYGWLDPRPLPSGTLISLDGGPRHPVERYERIKVGEHKLEVFAPSYYGYATDLKVADAQSVVLDPPLALYDRLPKRKAASFALGGFGLGLGLVTLGLATDKSTQPYAAPAGLLALAALGAGIYFGVTAPPTDEGGWGEARSWAAPGAAP